MFKLRVALNRKSVFVIGMILTLVALGFAGWKPIQEYSRQFAGVFLNNNQASERAELRRTDNPEGRAGWFIYQRMYPYDKIPDHARKLAWDDVVARGEGFGPEGVATTWTSIGPTPTAGAGPGGAVSGRINEIAVSPANTQIILVAGSTGGIWRSTNGGTTFVPVSDSQVDISIGTIAFAPSDSNIVYAGLGDNDNGYFGSGVLKSTNAGASWTRVSNNTLPDKVRSTKIKVDPANPNKLYLSVTTFLDPLNCTTQSDRRNCGENAGVYVSADGGVSWTRRINGMARDLAIHPTNAQIVYATISAGDDNMAPRGLFKSADGGTTWNNVFLSPFVWNLGATEDVRVAVTPAAADRVYVYVGGTIADMTPRQLRLEMSTDAGANWTNRGAVPTTAAGLDPGQFGYNSYLDVSPLNANTVWVGCRDFFRSTDGGVTFTNQNGSFQPPYPGGAFTEDMQKVHTDQQSFAFLPGSDSTFFVGNDGGIFKTTDSGATFTSLNATLSLAQFVGLALHPTDGGRSYAGAQDNGTQRRGVGSSNWDEFTQTGDGGRIMVNPANPTIIFAGGTQGTIVRNTENGNPGTAANLASGATFGATGNDPRIEFYAPVVGNGVDARVYSGSWRLYICTDCDTSPTPNWILPSMIDLTRGGNDTIKAIAVSKSNNNVIYTGSRDGRAMRSADNGVNWTEINNGLPTRSITNITVSDTDPTLVYLTVSGYGSGHVFRSTDSGGNWVNISNNLPDIPVSAFLINPLTPATIYAGTDIGVFRSINSGGNWSIFNTGLPPVPVTEFKAQAGGRIQISTYGRGAYELGAATVPNLARADYDADGRTDISVFRGSEGNWYLNRSTAGFAAVRWGTATDRIVPGDFDGDRKTDFAVWRPTNTEGQPDFFLLRSSDLTFSGVAWGTTADVPVVADYDGDGKSDYAVWRAPTGDFYVLQSQSGTLRHYNFGVNGDKPVPGDYDGDSKADFAVFRPSTGTWYIARSTNNTVITSQWGAANDIPVFADYDGDRKDDIAVFRPADGFWYIQKSTGGTSYIPFGTTGDIPAPGDYDGDGKYDQAVYRNGAWYLNNSTSGIAFANFGLGTDIPTPRNYLPN